MNYKTISLLLENDKKSRDRMQAFLDKNKAGNFYLSSMKTNVYISRNNLNKLKDINSKKGGFLPLIPILAGIAAAGSVAGGAAGIASAVNKKKAEDALIAETKRHNIQLEDAARGKGLNGGSTAPEVEEEEDESSGGSLFLRNGSSFRDHGGATLKEDVVNFVQENDLDNDVKRMVKKTLKGLASVIPMRKEGGSLILAPYKKGGSLVLRDWSEK